MKNIDKVINEYYKREPVAFLESNLDIKLSKFQKFLIKLAFKFKVKDNAKG